MIKTLGFLLLFSAVSLPQFAHGAIIINEFMYDAPGTDTDQEYVELFNAGAATIDLTKWKINDGANHTFNVPPKNGGTGSISIPAGGYVLLVDNATNFLAAHPGVAGNVIDTVLSLSNTGATIMLLDESGGTADSVTYTKDQGANGDGNSLQRSGTNWIAALPTMLSTSASAAAAQAQTTSATSTSTVPNSSVATAMPSYVAPPAPEVFADGGADRSVVVGADTAFRGRAYDKHQDLVEKVRFNWNFGDGTTGEGAAVLHHFAYPGKYAVVLSIAQNFSAASDRIIVTAEPANLGFMVNSDSSVSIENKERKEIDVSGWLIKSFSRIFTFPENTTILPGQTLRIANTTLGFSVGPQTELEYPNGVRAEISSPIAVAQGVVAPVATTSSSETIASAAVMSTKTDTVTKKKKSRKGARNAEDTTMDDAIDLANQDSSASTRATSDPAVDASSSTELAAAGTATGSSYLWWLGAFGLALAACGATFAVKRMKAGEWNIIDES